MSAVFLFPGQGSEVPGMGGASLTRSGPARTLVERVSAALAVDVVAIIARGDPALARTEVGQPALVALGIGLALEFAAQGNAPAAVAGHSVGEVAAFCLAGCLAPEEAVDCVIERARLMGLAARATPGGMAAVRVGSEELLTEALALGATAGNVDLAAHNSPQEWVVSGDRKALAAITARFATVPLAVAGPWHSRSLADVGVRWRQTLAGIHWERPRVPLVANATGRFVDDDDDLGDLLAGQLSQPVRWAETLRTLCDRLPDPRWHIFGPGRVLRGLCRANVGTSASVELHDGDLLPEERS